MLKAIIFIFIFLSQSIVAEVKGSDFSILSDEREKKLIFEQCSRMTPTFRTGHRDLDAETVAKIEKILPQALKNNPIGKNLNINDYKRQYVGFELLRRKIVYINAFHIDAIQQWAGQDAARQSLLVNWKTQAINVCGGFNNYWGALYDAQSGEIVEIIFNTEAKKKK